MERAGLFGHYKPLWTGLFPHMGVDALVLSLLSAQLHGPEIIGAARQTALVSREDLDDFIGDFPAWAVPARVKTWSYYDVRFVDSSSMTKHGDLPSARAPHVGPGPEEAYLYALHERHDLKPSPLFSTLMVNSRDLLVLYLAVHDVVGNKLLEDMGSDASAYAAGIVRHVDIRRLPGYIDARSVLYYFMWSGIYSKPRPVAKYVVLRGQWYDVLKELCSSPSRYFRAGVAPNAVKCVGELGVEEELLLLPMTETLSRSDLLAILHTYSPNGPLIRLLFPEEVRRQLSAHYLC